MANPNTTVLHTVVLGPGDCTVLPAGATVVSVTTNGTITATSSCGDLPAPSAYKCWKFTWETPTNDTAHDDVKFTGIEIGGTLYNLDALAIGGTNLYNVGSVYLAAAIPVATPAGLVINIDYEDADTQCLSFEIPETLGTPIIYFENPGFEYAAFIGAEGCGCP